MTIDTTRIATEKAKAAALRQRRLPVHRSTEYDAATFRVVYFTHGGAHELYGRAQREYEIEVSRPDTKQWIANHHMVQANNMMHGWMMNSLPDAEKFSLEYKRWCSNVSVWPEALCNRLHPAFKAIEDLGIDTDGQYRREYARMLADFNKAICDIDRKTAHLSGTAKWKARWQEYKAEITEFYYDEWVPFIDDLSARTGANAAGFEGPDMR